MAALSDIQLEINSKMYQSASAIYQNAETDILKRIAERVDKGLEPSGWMKDKAKDLRSFNEELTKNIAKTEELYKFKSSNEILKAYKAGKASVLKDAKLSGNILSDNTSIPYSVQRLIQENFQMASEVSFKILRNTNDIYSQIQAEVTQGVLIGLDTRQQAAQKMLNELADKGITGFVDKAGRAWSLGAYVEMATRASTANAMLQGHIDTSLSIGNDLMIVSDHAGSCPVCAPYAGAIISITGKTPGYPSLASAKAAGLFHPNCRHDIRIYTPGLTKINKEAGSKHSDEIYKYEQQQRANERAIRGWKKREAVAITPKDKQKATIKIKQYQSKQRALLKDFENKFDMTLARRYDRESLGFGTAKGKGLTSRWTNIPGKPSAEKVKAKNAIEKETIEKVEKFF